MKCEYCGTDDQKLTCKKCGAPIPEVNKDLWKSEPFFYNGYICYSLRNYSSDMLEVQFWLGRELIEIIKISQREYHSIVPECVDGMYLFWTLFLVARGEKEVFV